MAIGLRSAKAQIIVALLAGLGTTAYGAYSYSTQSAALDSAVAVNATVVSTSVVAVEDDRDTEYRLRATFNYTYEGETYTSSNVYPGLITRKFDSRSAARSQLRGYDPGDTVTAYVPPDRPGQAFLEHERSNRPFLVTGVGIVFLLIGGAWAREEFF